MVMSSQDMGSTPIRSTMNISIEDFYIDNAIDPNFDEQFYLFQFPEIKEFYQPYCLDNGIDDKHRLYFHYSQYHKKPEKQKLDVIKHNNNLYEISCKWQEPNITELHYFNKHKESITHNDDVYIGYSWANHIDKSLSLNKNIIEYIAKIPNKKYTICQHINWKSLINLWYSMGIDYIYVSHCEKNINIYYPNIRSWPLFASSVNPYTYKDNILKDKKYFASFVGCHRNDYRSSIRLNLNNYFHRNKSHNVFFELSDDWFYENNIYKNKRISSEQTLRMHRYNEIISQSIFSLCPEGTGPNTIRVWESMALGAIPVIYSDEWLPPQIPEISWEDFSVFIPKNNYDQTLEILDSINAVKIKQMQKNCIIAFNKFNNMTCGDFNDNI